MPRIPVSTSIPQDLDELFAAATNGRRPPLNLHAQMTAAPVVLAAYVGIRRALDEHSTLDRRTRFALMLAVSSIDRCAYTRAVNTVLAARAGLTDSERAAIVSGEPVGDRRLDALLAVARDAATADGHVANSTWRAAIDAGLGEQQLAEAYASIALSLYVDHFVNYAETPFDVGAPSAEAA